jgi:alkane 1-monooxygenase
MKKLIYYSLSTYPLILILIGNLFGSWYSALNIVNSLVIMILIEKLFPIEDKKENHISDTNANIILLFQAFTHLLVIASLLFGVYANILEGNFIVLAAISTGLYAGHVGIVNAHELIHRKEYFYRMIGIVNLTLVNYGHFYIEHIKGHHRFVGTDRDPATAKYGESLYQFILRTIPNQFISSYKLEAERLLKNNSLAFSFKNFIVRITFIEILICVIIFLFLGSNVLLAYLICSLTSILLLEYVNYIEHYGLVRSEGERVKAIHSWQSDLTFSRYILIELSRHSDHHYYASKHYQTLVSHKDSPVLPGGYFSIFYYAVIPSLWFKKINPIIDAQKINSTS